MAGFEGGHDAPEVVVEDGQDGVALFNVDGGGIGTGVFEVVAGPDPEVEVGVGVRFLTGDCQGRGQEARGG